MTAEDLRTKTTAELLAIRKTRPFTPAERQVMFGDPSADAAADRHSYQDELVRRLNAGEYLTKADKREARRIASQS